MNFSYAYVALWQPPYPLSQSVTPGMTPPLERDVIIEWPQMEYHAVVKICGVKRVDFDIKSANQPHVQYIGLAYRLNKKRLLEGRLKQFAQFWK